MESTTSQQKLNDQVAAYWQAEPCGTSTDIVGDLKRDSKEWFEAVERHRYAVEPCIHAVAQFARHRGKRVLEIGVGAGTDHLQWARSGTDLYGVDLTDAAIETTRRRLELYGLTSRLQRVDAETLPFDDGMFDVVYSWGVIHHSEHPDRIVREVHRVLKSRGRFVGMFYHRASLVALRVWIQHGLLAGRPWRSFADVLYHHVESIGTKAYSLSEVTRLFEQFSEVSVTPLLTHYDTRKLPAWAANLLPQSVGWFLAIDAAR